MPQNDFLTFGGDPAANVMLQTDYAATGFTPRLLGFSTGTAYSVQCNKVWRQSSLIASMIGQFTVDNSGQDMLDDGSPTGMTALQSHFTAAVTQVARGAVGVGYLPLTGGTLTGPLAMNSANAFTINAPAANDALGVFNRAAGHGAIILAETATLARWQLVMANTEAETGGNLGSNFGINRFADNGAYLGTPFTISRSTGVVNFATTPTVAGGDLPYLRLSGGTVQGPVVIIGNGVDYPNLGGHYIGFGWDGNFNGFVDGTYIGALATTSWVYSVAGNYLPISGGTIYNWFEANCSVTVDGTLFCRSTVYFSNLGDFANFYDGRYRYRQWAGGWYDYWDGQTGNRGWAAGGGNSMSLDWSANLTISGTFRFFGRCVGQGGQPSYGLYIPGGTSNGFWVDGSGTWQGWADGNGVPTRGLNLFNNDGTFTNWGGITSYNWMQCSQWFSAGGSGYFGGRLDVGGARIMAHNYGSIGVDGQASMGIWSSGNPWGLGIGTVDYYGNPTGLTAYSNPNGTFAAGGFYSWSSRAIKDNIRPSPGFDSLAALCRLDAREYDRDDLHIAFGFVAEEVAEVLPDAVQDIMLPAISLDAMIVHLCRAVAQLNHRIDALAA